jgi:hypothetical protein
MKLKLWESGRTCPKEKGISESFRLKVVIKIICLTQY